MVYESDTICRKRLVVLRDLHVNIVREEVGATLESQVIDLVRIVVHASACAEAKLPINRLRLFQRQGVQREQMAAVQKDMKVAVLILQGYREPFCTCDGWLKIA